MLKKLSILSAGLILSACASEKENETGSSRFVPARQSPSSTLSMAQEEDRLDSLEKQVLDLEALVLSLPTNPLELKGKDGANCYDSIAEDRNGDSVIDSLDCIGQNGRDGRDGRDGVDGQDGERGRTGPPGPPGPGTKLHIGIPEAILALKNDAGELISITDELQDGLPAGEARYFKNETDWPLAVTLSIQLTTGSNLWKVLEDVYQPGIPDQVKGDILVRSKDEVWSDVFDAARADRCQGPAKKRPAVQHFYLSSSAAFTDKRESVTVFLAPGDELMVRAYSCLGTVYEPARPLRPIHWREGTQIRTNDAFRIAPESYFVRLADDE